MAIGVSDEHEALRESARRFLVQHCPPAVPRGLLDAPTDERPAFWDALAALGWLGLHVEEEYGGSGYGLPELAVVLEELGRACAPGPFLPTVLASAVLALAPPEVRKGLLPGLVDGSRTGAVAFAAAPLAGQVVDGGLRVTGTADTVLGAGGADLVLLPVTGPDEVVWCALDAADAAVHPLDGLDPTRRVATVTVDGAVVPPERQVALDPAAVRDLAVVVLAAEGCGLAGWCLDTAAEHARVREQFGRPIGQFQAVKHRCADLLVAVEQSRSVAWDAARATAGSESAAFAVAAAGALVPEVAVRAGRDCIQVLGGIGFTWEHDAHLYLRRALSVRQLVGGPEPWRQRVAELALSGVRRRLDVELPGEAETYRAEVRAFVAGLDGLDDRGRRRALVESGYLAPHWPRPFGRSAGAVEQLVVDEELRRAQVRRPGLAIGAWVVPTLITYGTPEQQDRWVRPTLDGELTWCQLFSEPGAGSDLASIATKATRTEGGWLVTGQKVWTSVAREATHAILLARTGPPEPGNRRAGITYAVLDMRQPGVEVRPLRELTGQALFNEVFLTDAFVPDDAVIGEVGDGWRVARTTLANERVNMSSGSSFGSGIESLLTSARDRAAGDPVVRDRLGGLVAEAHSLGILGFRSTLRALAGGDPGPEASVRKLLGAEHEQRVQETGLELLGPAGATTEGAAGGWTYGFLVTRCLTIAGGTSEVQRNVIAERLLGLPRDPEPGR